MLQEHSSPASVDRADWVIACFESARAEMMFRINHRDRWLKQALLAQVVIWALAHGVKLAVEAGRAIPEIQQFALPVSLVFAALYYVEDGLSGRLSAYIGALPAFEANLRAASFEVADWDASPSLRDYAKYMNLILRVLAQFAAFILLPGMLAVQNYGWSDLPVLQWATCSGARPARPLTRNSFRARPARSRTRAKAAA